MERRCEKCGVVTEELIAFMTPAFAKKVGLAATGLDAYFYLCRECGDGVTLR